MSSKSRTAAVWILIMAAAACVPGWAVAGPKVVIQPKISTTVRHDSNYYKADQRERAVYTARIEPGIELGYQTAKTQITADYTLRLHYYFDADKRQYNPATGQWDPDVQDSDFVGHNGVLSIKTNPFDRVTFLLDETYMRTREPGAADRFSNSTSRAEYWVNRIAPGLAYQFGRKVAVEARYQSERVGYVDGGGEDSTESRGKFDLVYNFTPKRSMDLEYHVWTRDYDGNTSDYVSHRVMGIYRHQFNMLGLEAGAGYQSRDFDNPALEDRDVMAWRLALVGQNPPAPKEARSYFRLGAEGGLNDLGTGNQYFYATKLRLSGGHTFMRKILVAGAVEYQNSDYKQVYGPDDNNVTVGREDDKYMISGRVGYRPLDWLSFNVETGYEMRDSNLAGMDYDNVFMMATCGLAYDVAEAMSW